MERKHQVHPRPEDEVQQIVGKVSYHQTRPRARSSSLLARWPQA